MNILAVGLLRSYCWCFKSVQVNSLIKLSSRGAVRCSKDVRLPVQLQRAMAAEAEAAREASAKVLLILSPKVTLRALTFCLMHVRLSLALHSGVWLFACCAPSPFSLATA